MTTTLQAGTELSAASEGGGAALDQVIGLTAVAAVLRAALIWIGYLHRMRKITWLDRAAGRINNSEKQEGVEEKAMPRVWAQQEGTS